MCLGLQIFAQGLVLTFPEAGALGTPCLPSCFSCWGPWWVHHFGPLILEQSREVIFLLFVYLFSCIGSSLHHAGSFIVARKLSSCSTWA